MKCFAVSPSRTARFQLGKGIRYMMFTWPTIQACMLHLGTVIHHSTWRLRKGKCRNFPWQGLFKIVKKPSDVICRIQGVRKKETSYLTVWSFTTEEHGLLLCSNCSSHTGCRLGSSPTLWQTPPIGSAEISRGSLCWIDVNPPLGKLRACSTEKWWPQTQW